jgi:NADH-quinone oxidoreductase subunit J
VRDLFFYGISAALVGLAGITVLARNLFRAALALLGVLLCTAVLFILLQAELVALVQVMVYIGGIMIFVLYAVLLTSELGGRMPGPSGLKVGGAGIAAALVLTMLLTWAGNARGGSTAAEAAAQAGVNIASVRSLGQRLLDPGPQGFLVPFELISVVLLAAMVGAIAIARSGKPGDGP